MDIQVSKSHYDFDEYVNLKRWNSYYYQIYEIMHSKYDDILIIGNGDGIVANLLKMFNKKITILDFDENLKPDIVGSVTDIDKLLKKKYDIIVCCQVLEHIPFENFEPVIELFSRYASNKVIISLPNCRYWYNINITLPLLREKKFLFSFKKIFRNSWDINKQGFGEHYWEIDGLRQWKKKNIEKILKKYFELEKFYVVKENPYHMFFILDKKK